MKWDKEAKLLEEQFYSRGLQFTAPFEGLSLMQAYGYLDGQRFYFHLHKGNASLCVGVYDYATEQRKIQHLLEDMEADIDLRESHPAHGMPKESDPKLFPSVVLLASRIESSREPLVDVFSALIENLKPVKEPAETICI
jgi:hypothetical protein